MLNAEEGLRCVCGVAGAREGEMRSGRIKGQQIGEGPEDRHSELPQGLS